MPDKISAFKSAHSKDFMEEFMELCERYRLAVVPTYEGEVSLHDPMEVVFLDGTIRDYVSQRTYIPK